MPYIYNAVKAARNLTVQFQVNDIPQPIMTNFFIVFTKLIEKIFLAYKDNDKAVEKILGNITLDKEDEIKQLGEVLPGALLIMNLRQGKVASFKDVLSKEKIADSEIEKYATLMKDMVFCHIYHLICGLNRSIASAKKSQMWGQLSSTSRSSKIIQSVAEEETHRGPGLFL